MVQIKMLALIFLSVFVLNVKSWVFTDVNMKGLLLAIADEFDDDYVDQDADDITLKLSLIYPGTKWCGVGNIADDYDDLGTEQETDVCCRAHDNCPDYVMPGETKLNLTNDAFSVRFSCQCDETFRRCLRAVQQNSQSKAARNIGYLYFNGLKTKCFRYDYPVVQCTKRGGWLSEKCLEYKYETKSEKLYQWFDVRNF